MARTQQETQNDIINAKNTETTLAALNSPSVTAIWRLWTFIISFCQVNLDKLFDMAKAEITSIIASQKPGTVQWYVYMAKLFQFGETLPPDTAFYPGTNPAALIINYADAVELAGVVRIKVATLSGGVLAPVPASPELVAFTTYMGRVKYAGVRLLCTSGSPDNLHLKVAIGYDALVLDSTGARLDGTSATPVKDAIKAFLTNLPFNGLFILNRLREALEQVEGVIVGDVIFAEANYASTPYVVIISEYTPDAGYLTLDESYFVETYTAHLPL